MGDGKRPGPDQEGGKGSIEGFNRIGIFMKEEGI